MAGEVKWIKITTNIFEDEKILEIDAMPGRDGMLVIWFKLLVFCGKQNNGGILADQRRAYTPERLASIFHRDPDTIRMALDTFAELGMVEFIDDIITLPNWDKHQNVEGLEKIREQNRIRKRKQREKAMLCASRDVTGLVTECHAAEGEGEIEKEIELEKEEETEGGGGEEMRREPEQEREIRGGGEETSACDGGERTTAASNERLVDFTFSEALEAKCGEWLGYKVARGDQIETASLKVMLEKVHQYSQTYGEEAVCALIDECMLCGWRSIVFQRLERNPSAYQKTQPIAQEHTYSARPSYRPRTKAEELDDFYKMAVEWSERDD